MTDYAKPDSLPFRSYYAQQRRKKRKAANALVQRYITSLSAAGGMYYQLSEPVVIGAGEDFEIEVPVLINSTSSNSAYVFGRENDNTFRSRIAVFVDGGISVRTVENPYAIILPAGTYDQYYDKVVNLRLVRSGGNNLSLYANDILLGSNTISSLDTMEIDQFGSNYTSALPPELMYDLKIWTGGDRNTGTLVLDMPIDEDWKTSTDLHDAQGNVVGSAINVTESEADLYTLINDGTAWQSDTRTIQIAQ